MKFVHGSDIQRALCEISPNRVAVAYVGIDWKTYIVSENLQDIVLSPTLGTNPAAIVEIAEAIGWEHVYFLDNLHAKIYLGKRSAAVGSFNLTANGLGAGAEGLQEAGLIVEDARMLTELSVRLDDYQQQADKAYPTLKAKRIRLNKLRECWDRAIRQGVINNDAQTRVLADYRPVSNDEIYVCWYINEEPEYTDRVISPATIKDSLTFLESDKLQPDRWILCWVARGNGHPDRRSPPRWMHIDEVVDGGAQETPYTKLAIERTGRADLPPPFEITEKVREALYAILDSGKFPEFLGDGDTEWSINPTLSRLPEFLSELARAAA